MLLDYLGGIFMGKKQKIKQERKVLEQAQKQKKNYVKKKWLKWVIGIVILLALVVAGIFIYIRVNQERFIKLGLLTMAQQVQSEVYRYQGKFTLSDSKELKNIVREIQKLLSEEEVDSQVGGHLNFVLQTIREIARQGDVKNEEIIKLKRLLSDAKMYINVKAIKKAEAEKDKIIAAENKKNNKAKSETEKDKKISEEKNTKNTN